MKKMQKRELTEQVSKASLVTALAIIAGLSGFIKTGVSIYLTAAPLFLSCLILKTRWALITSIVSVVIVDAYTSWISFTWISICGYTTGILVLCLFRNKGKSFFMLGVALASLTIMIIYTLLWWFVQKEPSLALMMLSFTAIQMALVWFIVFVLYKSVYAYKKSVTYFY